MVRPRRTEKTTLTETTTTTIARCGNSNPTVTAAALDFRTIAIYLYTTPHNTLTRLNRARRDQCTLGWYTCVRLSLYGLSLCTKTVARVPIGRRRRGRRCRSVVTHSQNRRSSSRQMCVAPRTHTLKMRTCCVSACVRELRAFVRSFGRACEWA